MSHNKSESLKCFIYARQVLEFCDSNNIRASVTMYLDGSGMLNTNQSKLTDGIMVKLENLLKSNRWGIDLNNNLTLTSCCGWSSEPS